MKSTIRVDYDFDANETFIQLNIPTSEPHHMVDVDVKLDLADKHLKNFIEQSSTRGLELVYPNDNNDNSTPQIRLKQSTTTNNVRLGSEQLDELREKGELTYTQK